MSEAFVAACTHCGVKLKLKGEYLGKKVRCPKCQEPFVANGSGTGATPTPRAAARPATPQTGKRPPASKARAKADDDFGFLDDLDESGPEENFDDDFGEEIGGSDDTPQDMPVRKKKGAATKKKSRSGSGKGGQVAIIIGGAILGLGLLGGVVWGVMALVSGGMGGFSNRMAFMPDDIDMFTEIRVAELWSSPAMQPVRDKTETPSGLQEMKEATGLQPQDIDRVAIGARSKARSAIMVISTNKPFDRSAGKETKDMTEAEHQGKTYYKGATSKQTMYLPTSHIIVMGEEADVKRAIEIGNDSKAADNFPSIPSSKHLILAFKIPSGSVPPPGQEISPFGAAQQAAALVTNLNLTMQFTSDIQLDIAAICATAEDAEKVRSALSDLKDMAKGFIVGKASAEGGDTEQQQLMEQAKQALESIQVATSGNSATLSATVSGSLIEQGAKQAPARLPMGLPSPY